MKKYIKRQPRWKQKLRLIAGFPHTWICVSILIFSVLALIISYQLNVAGNTFLSSLFSNLFAGLVTGLVIYLIGGIKQISVIKLQEKKSWLEKLSKMIKQYFSDYDDLRRLHFDKFSGDEKLFNQIYDCGSHANWINDEIIQSSFSKILSFNSINYCKKSFSYHALEMCDAFEQLHGNLQMIDVTCPSSKEIIGYFDAVDHKIRALNGEVYKEKQSLEMRISEIQKTL